jgi:three-Cys-motif partner protein
VTANTFGGDWTEEKLDLLGKYLRAYRTIFTRNPGARHFRTWYVDAFAGSGNRAPAGIAEGPSLFDDVYADEDTTQYRDGSAKIALGLDEPFDKYLFIEKSAGRLRDLRTTVERAFAHLASRCEFERGDANAVLRAWCAKRDWKKERGVVFLDPFGMQVEWDTVAALASTKAVDLWYLFPLGVGVARLLKRDGNISEAWQKRLDVLFGTGDWRAEFYPVQTQANLFGFTEIVERDAPVAKIESFIHGRLAGAFAKAAKGRVLRNSKDSPLYLLCFAAANEKGAATAIRIAQSILDD